MRTFSRLLLASLLSLASWHSVSAEEASPRAESTVLRVAASTTAVKAGGKASLTTSVFQPKGDKYVGTYGIKVSPYFFKNETGSLLINVRPEALRQLRKGGALTFDGKAVTTGTGETRPITLEAEALTEREGKLKITIDAEDGKVVFNTTYRFEA